MTATSVGALLLCRADPETVRPVAHLLQEGMTLVPAGDGWSVLVPEGKPWRTHGPSAMRRPGGGGAEPVDRVVGGWATALAVGSTWPVIALWWDDDRSGFTLAAGFRRPVGYVWLADGTPVGEDEAMRTFAARLGLDPVLDVQVLEGLTRGDAEADSRHTAARPAGRARPYRGGPAARTHARRTGRPAPLGGRLSSRTPKPSNGAAGGTPCAWSSTPWRAAASAPGCSDRRPARWAGAQIAAGLPLTLWGARRRSGGWITAGLVLLAQGLLGLAYDRFRGADADSPGR